MYFLFCINVFCFIIYCIIDFFFIYNIYMTKCYVKYISGQPIIINCDCFKTSNITISKNILSLNDKITDNDKKFLSIVNNITYKFYRESDFFYKDIVFI